jgi:small subunit ribosomal protein S6
MSPAASREYELVLMLDPEIPEERREQIVAEARRRIESSGGLKHDTAWGMRKLAYEIRQRTEADYRFFRFETAEDVLDDLNHSLRIADGVLRFRIFKVDPRSPAIVPPPPLSTSGQTSSRGPRRSGSARAAADEAPAPRRAPAGATSAPDGAEATEGSEPAPAEATAAEPKQGPGSENAE